MKNIEDIFKIEIEDTIEALIGIKPQTSLEREELTIISHVIPPLVVFKPKIIFENSKSNIFIGITKELSIFLSESMLGEDIETIDTNMSITDDILDGTKELLFNIIGSIKNNLSQEKIIIGKSILEKSNISLMKEDSEISLEKYHKLYVFKVIFGEIKGEIFIAIDGILQMIINNSKEKDLEIIDKVKNNSIDKENLNIENIKDIKVKVFLRQNSKKIILKDVINMKIGDKISFNTNQTIEMVVDNKVIAHVEQVAIDNESNKFKIIKVI